MFKKELEWNLKAQNNLEFVGINDSLDFNADILAKVFLSYYESIYVKIDLTINDTLGKKMNPLNLS
jgi:hypothetical protein